MTSPPLLPEQRADAVLVAGGDDGHAAEPALPLGRLLLEDVVHERLAPADLAVARDLEALLGAAVRLLLGHRYCSVWSGVSCVSSCVSSAMSPSPAAAL